jgi:hypothetical protein
LIFHGFSCDHVINASFQPVLLYNGPEKMAGKHFVNQFKNTRRQAGLQGRRPLGGQARLQSGKKGRNAVGNMKKPGAGPQPWKKDSPE